jgi:hypothetical protein
MPQQLNDVEQLARDIYLRKLERLGAGYTTEGVVDAAFCDAEKYFAELERRRNPPKPAKKEAPPEPAPAPEEPAVEDAAEAEKPKGAKKK